MLSNCSSHIHHRRPFSSPDFSALGLGPVCILSLWPQCHTKISTSAGTEAFVRAEAERMMRDGQLFTGYLLQLSWQKELSCMWTSSGELRATAAAIVAFLEKQVLVPSSLSRTTAALLLSGVQMVVMVSIGLRGIVCRGTSVLVRLYVKLP